VLPIVAVQVSPAPPAPALEERLLSACSAGLAKARCVAARELSPSTESEPRAIAMVFFVEPARVSIEVGLSGESDTAWVSRELEFAERDPEIERWRAIGFTIALLADDRRFWAEPVAVASIADAPPEVASARPAEPARSEVDGRALAGTGIVGGALRLGAEARVAVRLASAFLATGSVSYASAMTARARRVPLRASRALNTRSHSRGGPSERASPPPAQRMRVTQPRSDPSESVRGVVGEVRLPALPRGRY
jgi:hypothetical protein